MLEFDIGPAASQQMCRRDDCADLIKSAQVLRAEGTGPQS